MDKQDVNFVEKESERIPDPAELRVKTQTPIKKLAGAAFSKVKEYGYVKMRAIGDIAIGRAFRAATIASGYLHQADVDAVMKGAFFVIEMDKTGVKDANGKSEQKTGSVITLEPR